MRNWLAHWLRKLATRLDGDLYFPVSPELKAAARDLVQDKFQRHVDESVLLWRDRLLFGSAYMINGKRVPPEDVVLNTRTGRFTVSKSNLEDAPPYRDHQGRACNCMMPGEPLTSGTKHLPMCPLYRKPRPDLDFEDPGITENGK